MALHEHPHRHVVESQVLLRTERRPEVQAAHELEQLEVRSVPKEWREAFGHERPLDAGALATA
eukprot:4889426-Pyramimonas_sp.AAC.1